MALFVIIGSGWRPSRRWGARALRSVAAKWCASTLVVSFGLAAAVSAAEPPSEDKGPEVAAIDPWHEAVAALAELDAAPTTGAAPGYLPDRVCAVCHDEIADSYAEVGMARAFARPEDAVPVEDLTGVELVHEASGHHYRMIRRDGRIVFTRWTLDDTGKVQHLIEIPVDWVLGSGHTSRTYLFQTPNGELYQLPIAWYSQGQGWGMAPGFDRPDHLGLQRIVHRECMFCHNAYPEVATGSDARSAPHRFPNELPEGIGCQRCHGPGARHAGLALSGRAEGDELRSAIVNPSRLPPDLREDVCRQCHLLPAVAMPGPRRLGRADYSFRPGEPLADYLVVVDVEEEAREAGERFEINHHPYRLDQSRCRTDGGRPLSCLACHDPHRRVPPEERERHYRDACLECHGREASFVERHVSSQGADCVRCHMPRRRTEDVIHVVMTDHRITRSPVGPEALAHRLERDPLIVDARVLDPHDEVKHADEDLYRTLAVVRAGATASATRHLEVLLRRSPRPHPDALLDLAAAAVDLAWPHLALSALDRVRPLGGPTARASLLRGVAMARAGDPDGALAALRRALELDPDSPEAHSNLGVVLMTAGDHAAAASAFRRALELRPTLALAWYRLAGALDRLDENDGAAEALRRSLAVEPRDSRAAAALDELTKRRSSAAPIGTR